MFGEAQVSNTFTQSQITPVNSTKGLSGYSSKSNVVDIKSAAGVVSPEIKTKTSKNDIDSVGKEIDLQSSGSFLEEDLSSSGIIQEEDENESQEYDYSSLYGRSERVPTTVAELTEMMGGTSSSKVSKEQLTTYLKSLSKNTQTSAAAITIVKNLIAQFDVMSDGKFITSLDGANEPQDYKTVTPEQVTLPIDIRI